MFYISEYLENHRDEYVDGLNDITEKGDWDSWIEFFLKAISEQAIANANRVCNMLRLYGEMKQVIPEYTQTLSAIKALDFIFKKPIFRSTDFVKYSGIAPATAFRILRVLTKKQVLRTLRKGSGRRPAILIFDRLINMAEGK